MSRFYGVLEQANYQAVKTGVLLTNLGTPEAPTKKALREYLSEFLSDPRVIEVPRVLWLVILHIFILPLRSKKSAQVYQSIWTHHGSPMKVISERQKHKLAQRLAQSYGDDVVVELAMRYGQSSIGSGLKKLHQHGVHKIVVLPLYPQYSGPTTGSTFDAVAAEVSQWRWVPSIDFISGYHQSEAYIRALENSVKQHIASYGLPDVLVMSYHGMPQTYFAQGDPYYYFCQQTTEALATRLELNKEQYVMTFQSRFGKAEWLKPYTDQSLVQLAKQGKKHIAIISPAFSADCLETLEELAIENKEIFIESGGETYHYIPCLNDSDLHLEALMQELTKHI
ncbi:ferrochelatase [Thalassotalea aquiviva]|uniref:ferrochelatase n=1 Tax=Thalassotalea aquiviva TaxID=3242415 RepID=UPI00352AD71D